MPKCLKTIRCINHKEVTSTLEYAQEIASALTDEQLVLIERFMGLEIWEQDLLLLRSKGYSLREIGDKLDVSYFWVRDKLTKIRKKLNNQEE